DVLRNTPKITGVAGDQHAATVGQACFERGMMKCTYGTGAFPLLNTGDQPVRSTHQLVTTIAYRVDGKTTYALEGSIFNAGTTIQWLRDGLKIIDQSSDVEWLAMQSSDDSDVVIVPAFTGLGAPHWRADALAAIFGLTRDTGRSELCRAALEAVVHQTFDLLEAVRAEGAPARSELRVDGGMVNGILLAQLLADICGIAVIRPRDVETTALGAAFLAGVGAGHHRTLYEAASYWKPDRRFTPSMSPDLRTRKLARWRSAVERLLA